MSTDWSCSLNPFYEFVAVSCAAQVILKAHAGRERVLAFRPFLKWL
jgi:hypothetical protein